MNRSFLEELGLEKEAIDKVMAEHGKTIQSVKPADDYEDLKKAKETFDSQLAGLQKTIDDQKHELGSVEELKKEVETYKLNDLKTTLAIKAGIPLELASRLSGETEEEIKSDAEKMAGFVNKQPSLPLKPTEPTDVDSGDQAYDKMLENMDL